jgi:hypothetical protein
MMHKFLLSRGWWVRTGLALALAMVAIVSQVRPTFAWSWPTKPVTGVVTQPVDPVDPDNPPVYLNSVNWGG